jgi:hypothetical protein
VDRGAGGRADPYDHNLHAFIRLLLRNTKNDLKMQLLSQSVVRKFGGFLTAKLQTTRYTGKLVKLPKE